MASLDQQRFGGVARLYGVGALERFAASRVLVVGIGGVGCWAVEALARSGVGSLTLVDLDELCVTNVNRQLHALDADIGRPKVSAMAERVRGIHPGAEVIETPAFYTEASADSLLGPESAPADYDLVLDCIDRIRPKVHLIASCRARALPVLISGAAGGRLDPGRIQVEDLARVGGDSLLRQVRKKLRDEHGWPAGDHKSPRRSRRFGLPAVFSDEPPTFPTEEGGTSCERPRDADGAALRLNCASGYGTSCPVVASFGLRLAAEGLAQLAASA